MHTLARTHARMHVHMHARKHTFMHMHKGTHTFMQGKTDAQACTHYSREGTFPAVFGATRTTNFSYLLGDTERLGTFFIVSYALGSKFLETYSMLEGYVYVLVGVCVRERACVRACVRARARACLHVWACVSKGACAAMYVFAWPAVWHSM